MTQRIAIWCAVSSEPQAKKVSLESQERAGREYARTHGGHVVAVYRVAQSRDLVLWPDDIPGYRQLRADVEAGRVDVLVARDPDRLGRDPALSNQVVSLCVNHGAAIHFTAHHYTLTADNISHRYLFSIQSTRSQEMQKIRVARHADGMADRVRSGLVAAVWPIGYTPIRDQAGECVGAELDPATAPAVRLATRMFIAGEPYLAIQEALNASGYPPPRADRWHHNTVRGLLHNDTYAGFPTWNDVRPDEPSDKYPALWDPDTFAAVKAERQRRAGNHHITQHGAHPFQGVIFCARCGHVMSRQLPSPGRTHTYYRCARHAGSTHTGQTCHPNFVREEDVISALQQRLQELANPDTLRQALAATQKSAALEGRLQRIQRRIQDLQQQRRHLARTLAQDRMDPELYHDTDQELRQSVDSLTDDRDHLRQQLTAVPDVAQRLRAIQHLAAALPQLLEHAPGHRVAKLLHAAGLRIECEDKHVTRITVS
jgi:site-specific DNA recombinase